MNAAKLYEAGRYRQVMRDPFARGSLLRFSARALGESGPCKWCGQDGRWCYAWDHDARSPRDLDPHGPYCSRSCHDSHRS